MMKMDIALFMLIDDLLSSREEEDSCWTIYTFLDILLPPLLFVIGTFLVQSLTLDEFIRQHMMLQSKIGREESSYFLKKDSVISCVEIFQRIRKEVFLELSVLAVISRKRCCMYKIKYKTKINFCAPGRILPVCTLEGI